MKITPRIMTVRDGLVPSRQAEPMEAIDAMEFHELTSWRMLPERMAQWNFQEETGVKKTGWFNAVGVALPEVTVSETAPDARFSQAVAETLRQIAQDAPHLQFEPFV